jgi:hypothetical protein
MPKREREIGGDREIDGDREPASRSKVRETRSPLAIFTMENPQNTQNTQNTQEGNSFSDLSEYLNRMHIG